MATKKNLAGLAKGKAKTTKTTTTTAKKKTSNLEVDERDLKAKQKVEELLQDIKLTKDDEKQPEKVEDKKGVEWLEEQLQTLTERNEVLEKEAVEAKENYKKLHERMNSTPTSNPDVEAKVVQLFDELQNGYLRYGKNFIVYFPAFLNRMILFFPFLEKYKKFK